MLIMKCPECSKYIRSALLAEITSIACEHCRADVAVANVLVSSNGFTFDRQDLLKRFYRYRKLLDEVIDEHNSLTGTNDSSVDSKNSIKQFLNILQGMMTGARDNYRVQFSAFLWTKVSYGEHECNGAFYNLSMEGARIEIYESNPLPKVKEQISLQFSLPDQHEVLCVTGEICWTEKAKGGTMDKHNVGIKFNDLDSSVNSVLWQFISRSASEEGK